MGLKNWPLNTGDFLIQVAFKAGLTVFSNAVEGLIMP